MAAGIAVWNAKSAFRQPYGSVNHHSILPLPDWTPHGEHPLGGPPGPPDQGHDHFVRPVRRSRARSDLETHLRRPHESQTLRKAPGAPKGALGVSRQASAKDYYLRLLWIAARNSCSFSMSSTGSGGPSDCFPTGPGYGSCEGAIVHRRHCPQSRNRNGLCRSAATGQVQPGRPRAPSCRSLTPPVCHEPARQVPHLEARFANDPALGVTHRDR